MSLDYKYIEQLLDRYFEGETTLEEEKILRAFFCQESLPESLLPYRDLFLYEQLQPQQDRLGADFDERLMAAVSSPSEADSAPRALRIMRSALRGIKPFCKAAAVVAVIITVGNASQALFTDDVDTTSSVATIQTTTGKNVADMPVMADTLHADTLHALR